MLDLNIREATFPQDLNVVRMLFCEYANGLGVDLCFQNFETELAELPGRYAPPAGGLWLAVNGDQPAGCAAFRPIDGETCEMKRLYVRPTFRGHALGRRLAERIIVAAREAGHRRICLDTMPSMVEAIRLYESLGFVPIQAYCHNPVTGAMFLGLELASKSG